MAIMMVNGPRDRASCGLNEGILHRLLLPWIGFDRGGQG